MKQKKIVWLICWFCLFGAFQVGAQGVISSPQKTNKQKKQSQQIQKKSTLRKHRSISNPNGMINGHGYVDLGLPSGLKWATCNVGATNPSEIGDYYAWGETKIKKEYTPNNCLTNGKTKDELISMKYINSNGTLLPEKDIANLTWGSGWRIPTEKEQYELMFKCDWIWINYNGKNGYKIVGPNGNSIFLVAGGEISGYSNDNKGECGSYWSASIEENTRYSSRLGFGSEGVTRWYSDRFIGKLIRPVRK